METEAIDNQANLVNYDNENEYEIEDLGYESEEYTEDAHEDDENNHSNGYAKRGITRLCKFRREYGKPGGVKLSVTFDALNRISGKHRALFSSFLGDMVREHIGLQILSWKKVGPEARNKLWDEITRYFDVDLTVRKLVMNRLGQLLRNFRRKLRQTYILPNQDTPSKLNEVPAKYSIIEKKEIEPDEEPPRGTLWLKGRVNKDGEYLDDEIRSMGDKLGTCVFTDKWSLDELAYGVPRDGPYQTNPPSPDDIISYIRNDREGLNTRTRHRQKIDDYVPACLCYMLYCISRSEKFNLAYYMAKRMEWVIKQARLILPYGMLLTCLFKFIMSESLELVNESYVLYDCIMNPLTSQQERKTRKYCGTRRGCHSTSSTSAFDHPSSSHLNDDDGNDERTSRASTPSPTHFVNLLTNEVPRVFQNPLNIDPDMEPFYTRQTEIINRQVQL
ncbi:hypothetical protein Tco_0405636 [Tanacetum coccineum]